MNIKKQNGNLNGLARCGRLDNNNSSNNDFPFYYDVMPHSGCSRSLSLSSLEGFVYFGVLYSTRSMRGGGGGVLTTKTFFDGKKIYPIPACTRTRGAS
jgi:hypothetical protein